MAFPVFFPSLVRFPLFGSCRSLFSFVNSLCLSPFFSLSSSSLACWRCGGVFIGQKGAGASLLPPYSSAWGAGLCCPTTTPGWLANGWGWQGAASLVFFHQESAWGVWQAGGVSGSTRKEEKNYLPLLHVQGKEKGEQCRSKRHCSAPFFSYMKRRRFI